MTEPAALIVSSPLGTRMTVRRRIEGGFTDALGYLRAVTDTECVIESRRGLMTVPLEDVTAVKLVPPPPPPRAPRRQTL